MLVATRTYPGADSLTCENSKDSSKTVIIGFVMYLFG